MIEEVITKLDQRGLMVLTVLIGKRMMELLKSETKDINLHGTNDTLSIPKDTTEVIPLGRPKILTGLNYTHA